MEIDIKNDCSRFPMHSRQWQLCEGLTDMPLDRVNKIRAMYGIPPLVDEAPLNDPALPTTSKVVVVRSAKNTTRNSQPRGCCGGSGTQPMVTVSAKRMVEGTGVGGRLIEIFKSHGFETCEACYELAHRMNEWGVDGCQQNLEAIVAEILPRALEWEAAKVGWWAKLLPDAVTAGAVRLIVENAIATARPLEWVGGA